MDRSLGFVSAPDDFDTVSSILALLTLAFASAPERLSFNLAI